jgi:ribosome-associated heat shock protein Hsp15
MALRAACLRRLNAVVILTKAGSAEKKIRTMTQKVRLDKYLWAIRVFKTRTLASQACDQGKVKFMGHAAKAAKTVNIGDEFEIKAEARKWVIKVTDIIDKRVQYAEAIKNYVDLTPAEELDRLKFEASAFYTGKRNSKIGRPTKKQRRDLEEFTGE